MNQICICKYCLSVPDPKQIIPDPFIHKFFVFQTLHVHIILNTALAGTALSQVKFANTCSYLHLFRITVRTDNPIPYPVVPICQAFCLTLQIFKSTLLLLNCLLFFFTQAKSDFEKGCTPRSLTPVQSHFSYGQFLYVTKCIYGQVRLVQVMLGQVRLDQVRLGQVRLGQVWLGQVRLGYLWSLYMVRTV